MSDFVIYEIPGIPSVLSVFNLSEEGVDISDTNSVKDILNGLGVEANACFMTVRTDNIEDILPETCKEFKSQKKIDRSRIEPAFIARTLA